MTKNLFLLCTLVLAIAVSGASAQNQINFADLPLVSTATPLPSGYGGLNWANFLYVDPNQYASAGTGYNNLFTHRDVAFIGGLSCGPLISGCYGVINSRGGPTAFEAVSAIMAAGYQGNQVRMLAYNNGKFVGSMTVLLGTTPHLVTFPESWGSITELQIKTDAAGDVVLFDLAMYLVAG
jgi:hypothetical protein